MTKIKKCIIVFCALFIILLNCNPSYADIDEKYLTPNLKITSTGIKFDDSSSEKSFKKAQNEVSAINTVLKEYEILINAGSAIVSLTLIGIFIVNFIKLGNTRGNPQERQKVISSLIVVGLATAMAGSVTVVTKLFFNFMQ